MNDLEARKALKQLEQALGFDPNRPCIFCNEPVTALSHGGIDVCPCCDSGCNRDGTPWTTMQAAMRHANARKARLGGPS